MTVNKQKARLKQANIKSPKKKLKSKAYQRPAQENNENQEST